MGMSMAGDGSTMSDSGGSSGTWRAIGSKLVRIPSNRNEELTGFVQQAEPGVE